MRLLSGRTSRVVLLLVGASLTTGCLHDSRRRMEVTRTETFDLMTRAQMLKDQGDYLLAKDLLLEASAKSPRPVIYYEIGNCYFRLQNLEEAEAYYQKALELQPEYSLAQAELDLVRQAMAMAEEEKAKAAEAAKLAEEAPAPVEIVVVPLPTPTPAPEPEPAPIEEPPPPTPSPTPFLDLMRMMALATTRSQDTETGPTMTLPVTPLRPVSTATPTPIAPPTATPVPAPVALDSSVVAPKGSELSEAAPVVTLADDVETTATLTLSERETTATLALVPVAELSEVDAPVETPISTPEGTTEAPAPGTMGILGGFTRAFSSSDADKNAPQETPRPEDVRDVVFPELGSIDKYDSAAEQAMAEEAERLSRFDEAVRLWGRVISYEPTNVRARLQLANALLRSGRTRRAEEEIQAAVELAPTDSATWFEAGKFYLQAKENSKARVALRRAVQYDAQNIRAWNNLGAVEMQLGSHTEAILIFERVIEQEPLFAPAHLNLALARDNAKRPAADVLEALQSYMRISPSVDAKTNAWRKQLIARVASGE